MNQCVLCGTLHNKLSKEHIVPRWLQKYFNLNDQKLGLSNGTSIKYNQAVVPACHTCNSEIFSSLEKRIRENTSLPMDYYLWALKVSYALSYKDTTLPIDRSDPAKGTIIPKEMVDIDSGVIYSLFNLLSSDSKTVNPSPFGSVFVINKEVDKDKGFFLVDVPAPYRALAITLPDRILFVLFGDRGVVQKITPIDAVNKLYESIKDVRYILFHLLKTQNQLTLPSQCIVSEKGIESKPIPTKILIRKQKQVWYEEIANFCGLPIQYGALNFEKDQKMTMPKYFKIA
ncbi:hypothetical protein CGK23_22745 [Vibrio parahaemolyticus]|uniref:hypothetical protein n=1 Tax=Vibrio parahaemolyticus TaxID=670 RepID=UPI0011212B0B|nr:hypothetical protein [Vibrio parahaemolyticus]TOA55131.1 hypothetical protein CGK23_22745 [Vibrio parahaemolyticus]